MKQSFFRVALFAICAIGFTACQCDIYSDCQDLTLGTQYTLGNTFTTYNADISIMPFTWSGGGVSPTGFIKVQDQSTMTTGAGGTAFNLEINNINAEFKLPRPAKKISFKAGHWGGNMNLRINGVFRNFERVADINGTNLGGVMITATGSKNNPGLWEFKGHIDTFEVGGQEFYIDDICIENA